MNVGERVRLALVELGPTFIKFGQLLSNRKDIVPREILVELEQLQDRVPPFPVEEAEAIVVEQLGRPLDQTFVYFNREPEAAASLAQVHRAILPTGRPVAVKIKRPGIDQLIANDVEIMYQLASFIDANTSLSSLVDATELVAEFDRQMRRELSFVQEMLNIKRFAKDFEGNDTVVVPTAYDDYTTENVLVMDFIHGRKVAWILEAGDSRYDAKLINQRTAEFIMTQLFITGFFHADPHPGNFLVLENNVICFIDFGMMYSLRPYEQDNINYMMIGLGNLDPVLVARSLLRITRGEGEVDASAVQSAVHDYIETHLDKPLEYINVSEALIDLLQLSSQFGMKLPPRLIYFAKVIGMLEAIGTALDPEYEFMKHLKRFSNKIWANQLASRRAGNRALVSALDYGELALDAPAMVKNLARFLDDRRLTLHVEEGPSFRDTYDKVGFRLVFGLVLSSMLISSSLIVLADIEPRINGIPIFGIIGFATGGVMGLIFLLTGFVKLFKWHKHE
jgi:ubiquinone biosynthesis protein